MKTKNKKFQFLKCFNKNDIEKFPNGWITKSDVPKLVLEDIASNDDDDNLINKILLIPPNIWGNKELYWKNETYHPTLKNKDMQTMETDVLLIGKIIKEIKHIQQQQKKKFVEEKIFETVLMCDSYKLQANEFSEKQCRDMLIQNFSLHKSEDIIMSSEKMHNLVTLKETRLSINSNVDSDSSSSQIQVNKVNKQDCKNFPKKKQISSKSRNMHAIKKSSDSDKEMMQIDEVNNQDYLDDRKEIQVNLKKRKISPKKKPPVRNKQVTGDIKEREKRKIDFMIHESVAFDFYSDHFQKYVNAWDPKVVSKHQHQFLEKGKYIKGVIDRKAKKQKGQDYADYLVCWEYSTTGINNIQISMQEAVAATHLSKILETDEMLEKMDKINNRDVSCDNALDNLNSSFHKFKIDDVDGNPIESDDELSDVEIKKRLFEGNCTYDTSKRTDEDRTFETCGLKWKKDYRLNAAQGIRPKRETYLKPKTAQLFRTEIESFLAFLPIQYWMWHLDVTNYYAKNHTKPDSTKKNSGCDSMKDIHIQELMTFYAILMQISMKPHPGSRYTECWSEQNKVWYTACKKMSRKRFDEIRFALHWCENKSRDEFKDVQTGKLDTLYKVRPLLTVIQQNLGRYLIPCTNLALDETCIAIRSVYARNVTFYNPNKPKGKHHLKFYTLCENDHWCALIIKMCHRQQKVQPVASADNEFEVQQSSLGQDDIWARSLLQHGGDDNSHFSNEIAIVGYKPSLSENLISQTKANKEDLAFLEDNEIYDENIKDPNSKRIEMTDAEIGEEVQKTIRTVTDMCRKYYGTGRIINMDNLYSSPEVFIALKNNGLYARGTVRLNRKYLPKFIKYMRNDLKKIDRGSYEFASNIEYNMSMHCWHDSNPVHMLSSCDSTGVDVVKRQSHGNKVTISCPVAVKKYNENMQAVDQFNGLISLFSLGESHTFTKYYKKIAMVLMDLVLVNAYLHRKIHHEQEETPKPKKKLDRKEFMENLIDALINIDWADMVREHQVEKSKGNVENWITENSDDGGSSSDENELFSDKVDYQIHQEAMNVKNSMICRAVTFDKSFAKENLIKKPKSKFYCKVCIFEGRGNNLRNSVFCSNHGIALCQTVNIHPMRQTVFKIGSTKESYVQSSSIKDWEWLSPSQEKWTCWEKAHRYYIPNGLFKVKDVIDSFGIPEKSSSFHMMSKPYILRKKALSGVFYRRGVGTKSTRILKRDDAVAESNI